MAVSSTLLQFLRSFKAHKNRFVSDINISIYQYIYVYTHISKFKARTSVTERRTHEFFQEVIGPARKVPRVSCPSS